MTQRTGVAEVLPPGGDDASLRFSAAQCHDKTMKILLAGELGANFGHLARQRPVAEILREQGHDVAFAVSDTTVANAILGPAGFRFVQSPIALAKPRRALPPANYSEVLLAEGFHAPAPLAGRVRAWQGLFEAMRPDALLLDHAPTALLAARLADRPCTVFGTGFTVPPEQSPYPCFRTWEPIPADRLMDSERLALANINAVRRMQGKAAQAAVHELFEGAGKGFMTLPEMDHYGVRSGERYLGPIFGELGGSRIEWPTAQGHHILAYLRPDTPGFQVMVEVLKRQSGPVILATPQAPDAWVARHASARFAICNAPIDVTPLLADCDLGVSYGGSGTLSQFLLAGIPQLILPKNAEQYLGGFRIQEAQAGLLIGKARDAQTLAQAIAQILTDPVYRQASRAMAARYTNFHPRQAAQHIAEMVTRSAANARHAEASALSREVARKP